MNGCGKCQILKSKLDNNGMDYELINIDESETGREFIINSGFSSFPVLVNGDSIIFGNDTLNIAIGDLC